MNKILHFLMVLSFVLFIASCGDKKKDEQKEAPSETINQANNEIDRFADLSILQYKVASWDSLTPQQRVFAYYLSQAALAGRDIFYDQNYKHNIQIRKTLEQIYEHFKGSRDSEDWESFETYLKRVWFSSGIHHHYAYKKFVPSFEKDYFNFLIKESPDAQWPLKTGESLEQMIEKLSPVIFDPSIDNKKVVKDKGRDHVLESANNFYEVGITSQEAEAFYNGLKKEGDQTPISYGLNSQLIKGESGLTERVYKVNGLYSKAIQEMISWLEKAKEVAETENQKKYIELLIKYYQTGDLKVWDECNIQWVNTVDGDLDFIHGFIEVYDDAIGYKAAYESVIQIKDFEAGAQMQKLSENAQWFEDNSPIMKEHKKENVKGITYNMVQVVMEAGATAPSTPIGINLPNANWIRAQHGSKSVSLSNIVEAYESASSGGSTEEFYLGEDVIKRRKEYATLAGKLHTAMHEVIGHASGKLNEGVGTPKETLKNYSSTLEEARADLVALYYLMDQKLVDLGLMPSLEVGKAEYDGYIANGLMLQLKRLEPGDKLEEDHMRNRQLVAKWCYEQGKADNVIERKSIDGKTYFVINDYNKLRDLFGQLLRIIQKIKSEGDFATAENLVETYGVEVDQELLKEVKKRYEKLDIPPYSGFIQPKYTPIMKEGKMVDVSLEYPKDFAAQMMEYSKNYSFLSVDDL